MTQELAWIPTALFRANGIGIIHLVFPWFLQGAFYAFFVYW